MGKRTECVCIAFRNGKIFYNGIQHVISYRWISLVEQREKLYTQHVTGVIAATATVVIVETLHRARTTVVCFRNELINEMKISTIFFLSNCCCTVSPCRDGTNWTCFRFPSLARSLLRFQIARVGHNSIGSHPPIPWASSHLGKLLASKKGKDSHTRIDT